VRTRADDTHSGGCFSTSRLATDPIDGDPYGRDDRADYRKELPVVRNVVRTALVGALVLTGAASSFAQSSTSFKVANREVQVHGSIQQGFVVSDNNNFLTMDTSDGTAAMTDGAFNASTQISKQFRVGAQLYSRNVGQLGNGQVQFDWVYGDYKFNDSFGVRAGKVKTPLGLFNDTQDMEFLYTWALLPQSVYPMDRRAVSIAHVGADVYGTVDMKKAGTLNYTGYFGIIPDDSRGGYRYGIEDAGFVYPSGENVEQKGGGFDLRWTAPVDGLTAGYSLFASDASVNLLMTALGNMPVTLDINDWQRHAFFADYQKNQFRFSGELRLEGVNAVIAQLASSSATDSRSWFLAGSYRVNKYFEVGSYYNSYVTDTRLSSSADDNHVSGPAVTARFDINKYWNVKVEGQFMDGYGNMTYSHGFYVRNNGSGVEPRTNLLVVRTGFNF
jgi:hypothetical protein